MQATTKFSKEKTVGDEDCGDVPKFKAGKHYSRKRSYNITSASLSVNELGYKCL